MRYALLGAVLFLSMFVASDALAACYECDLDPYSGDAVCTYHEEVNAGLWADCEGGQTCFYLPGGGWWCTPYCSRHRCYLV
jgi:hypothetical protein